MGKVCATKTFAAIATPSQSSCCFGLFAHVTHSTNSTARLVRPCNPPGTVDRVVPSTWLFRAWKSKPRQVLEQTSALSRWVASSASSVTTGATAETVSHAQTGSPTHALCSLKPSSCQPLSYSTVC
eukprot:983717-Amphidinium_carterae.1